MNKKPILSEEQKKYLTKDIDTSDCKTLQDAFVKCVAEALFSMANGLVKVKQIKQKYEMRKIRFRGKNRKNRLKDGDVREIAKMQMRIDYYEQSFLKLWQLAQGKDPGLTLLRDDELDFPVIDLLYKSISTLTNKNK